MEPESFNIKTDLKIGQGIFENVPDKVKPNWAGLILSRFDNYIKNVPDEIKELLFIADNPEHWKDAHEQFNNIRIYSLKNPSFQPESYLTLAEKVAKVTYNSSGEPAPFDKNSGWFIPSLALQTADFFEDANLQEEIKSTILIFNRNMKFKKNFEAAKDFIIYKKIDDILWNEWDPIGINDLAPRDEYQSYVPEIFSLKKTEATREDIANKLFKFEIEIMGLQGVYEKCLTIADKILKIN